MICQKDVPRHPKAKIFPVLLVLLTSFSPLDCAEKMGEGSARISEVRKYGRGEIRTVEGIPFLKLSGNYYEMGEQFGVLLKEEFKKIHKELEPYKSAWLPRLPDDIYGKIENITPHRYIQQLKGMAAGSGLPYEDLLMGAYFGVLERGGCSSILLKIKDNGETVRLLHGRNYDYGKGTGKYPAVVEYRPEGEHRYLSIGTIASVALAEGMNEKGITVSTNLARGDLRDNKIESIPAELMLKDILGSASSLNEVRALMEGYASDVGVTLTIGSGFENEGVIYDVYYDDLRMNPFEGANSLFVTNNYASKELNPKNECPRYQIIKNHVESGRVESINGLIKVLSDPGGPYGVNNPSTIHSVVFDPRKKNIFMAFHTKFAAWNQWLKYDWERDTVAIYKKAEADKLKNTDTVELTEVHIIGAYWQGDDILPNLKPVEGLHFVVAIKEWLKEKNVQQLYDFSARAAREMILKAEGRPDIRATITKGTIASTKIRGFWFCINEDDLDRMDPGVPYTIHIENISAVYKWIVEDGVTVARPKGK